MYIYIYIFINWKPTNLHNHLCVIKDASCFSVSFQRRAIIIISSIVVISMIVMLISIIITIINDMFSSIIIIIIIILLLLLVVVTRSNILQDDVVYTNTGPVLIAVNPFKTVPFDLQGFQGHSLSTLRIRSIVPRMLCLYCV